MNASRPYLAEINEDLRPRKLRSPLVLDLFAGCGGLALGFEAAGFDTRGYEMDGDASDTYRKNLTGDCSVEFLNCETEYPQADVIIGGPPCQPFSVGGRQAGQHDDRNGFPAFLAAIEKVQPTIFVAENVRGMMYRNRPYLAEVLAQMESLGYDVQARLMNAKHHGVPQNRERVVIVGSRVPYTYPEPMTSLRTAGEAIHDLASTAPENSRFLTPNQDAYIAKYERASKCKNPRDLAMERPARTLTCRNLGGSTGDMHRVCLPDGRRRQLLVREAARLQSFPDWFEFAGSQGSVFKQIGNAVAPLFAKHLAESVRNALEGRASSPSATLF